MNTKMIALLAISVSVIGLSARADDVTLNVQNGSDDGIPALAAPKGAFGFDARAVAPNGLQTQYGFYLGQDGVEIASEATLNSPSLTQARINTMAGLARVLVPMDLSKDAAAWGVVAGTNQPNRYLGFQWWHSIGSTPPAKSWMGTFVPTGITNDYGNRVVISCSGNYPVSAYYMDITSSLTNVSPSHFYVATNTTSGFENPCSSTFMIIYPGANGVYESYYDYAQGKWIAGGDDVVYQNGELPSSIPYTNYAWFRFGATVQLTVSSASGYDSVIKQFANGDQYLYATLSTNGPVLASKYVLSALPKVTIPYDKNTKAYQVGVTYGQLNVPYSILSTTNLTPPQAWIPFQPNHTVFSDGTPLPQQFATAPQMYFRAVQVHSP